MLRLWIGLVLGFGTAALPGCEEDYECGERNLPGTLECPCLPGGVCAEGLECDGGRCYLESATSSEGGGSTATSAGHAVSSANGRANLSAWREHAED